LCTTNVFERPAFENEVAGRRERLFLNSLTFPTRFSTISPPSQVCPSSDRMVHIPSIDRWILLEALHDWSLFPSLIYSGVKVHNSETINNLLPLNGRLRQPRRRAAPRHQKQSLHAAYEEPRQATQAAPNVLMHAAAQGITTPAHANQLQPCCCNDCAS
jgi:hypothetical protein